MFGAWAESIPDRLLVVVSVDGGDNHREHCLELFGPTAFFQADANEKPLAEVANDIVERLTKWRETATIRENGAS